jgi:hypothetical protein
MTDDEVQALQVTKGILREFIQTAPPPGMSDAAIVRTRQNFALMAAMDNIDRALTLERKSVFPVIAPDGSGRFGVWFGPGPPLRSFELEANARLWAASYAKAATNAE